MGGPAGRVSWVRPLLGDLACNSATSAIPAQGVSVQHTHVELSPPSSMVLTWARLAAGRSDAWCPSSWRFP
jgi:hypothetical protein